MRLWKYDLHFKCLNTQNFLISYRIKIFEINDVLFEINDVLFEVNDVLFEINDVLFEINDILLFVLVFES